MKETMIALWLLASPTAGDALELGFNLAGCDSSAENSVCEQGALVNLFMRHAIPISGGWRLNGEVSHTSEPERADFTSGKGSGSINMGSIGISYQF